MTRLFDALLAYEVLTEGTPDCPLEVPPLRPGVTRLQHAGLLYRGCEAGILVDPHVHSTYQDLEIATSFSRPQFEGLVDAIVISHSHHDHYHLSSLMMFPRDMPIIVPRVLRSTILCPNIAASLAALGFTKVTELGWYDPPVQVGDLEIHALPFLGEQPLLREAPRHPDLRNHGNTYVVRHKSYTSWFLIDSGNEKDRGMADVAHEVWRRFGPIDFLLSNLRRFGIGSPSYITGGGHYWLSLTPDQMRRFASMRKDVITLGPVGVAEVCGIVKARTFLPYAHWWGEVGAATPEEQQEATFVEGLRAALANAGANTVVRDWLIGDSFHFATM